MAEMADSLTDTLDLESSVTKDDHLQLRVWLRLLTCATLIEREIRKGLREDFTTTLPRYDALAQLERSPNGLTMGQLSRRMMVSNGNVTGVVDGLVSEGLAERLAVPGDRRASYVRMTRKGKQEFNRITPIHHSWIRDMLEEMGRSELTLLFNALGDLKSSILTHLEQEKGNPEAT